MRARAPTCLLLGSAAADVARAETPQRLVDAFEAVYARGTSQAAFALPSTQGDWVLTLERSGLQQPRARVWLNGAAVVAPSDFRPGQRVLRVPLSPQATNLLKLKVTGPGTVIARVQGVVPERGAARGSCRVAEQVVHEHVFHVSGLSVLSVQVPVPKPGLYRLEVQNGLSNGQRRVLLGTVPEPWSCPSAPGIKRRTASATAPLVLEPANTLTLVALGAGTACPHPRGGLRSTRSPSTWSA
ncbi:MAG: hypothetical protein R3F62_02435 [Planctomycetota bacterium]